MPAINAESKALSSGSPPPKVDDSTLTVYSMRFCPYAERTRLVLNKKNVTYDVVNINLKDKPEWFLERNPLGKCPTVVEPGKDKPLFESLICAEYFDEKYPDNKLLPSDQYERARQKIMIEVLAQKVNTNFYKAVTKQDDTEALKSLKSGLDEVEKMLTKKYFAGDKMGFVDPMAWPWFERIEAMNEVRKDAEIKKDRYPKIFAWIETMLTDPAVKETTHPKEFFVKFMQAGINGKSDYDAGL